MIPVNEPVIGEREIAYVNECLTTGWVSSSGRFIDEFESQWAEYCGVKHGIAVSNGTVALELALACLDLEPGSEVILPSFTIISCALAVVRNGLTPVLVDSEPDTWAMDVQQVERMISPRTRAVMPVHMYGHPVDMDPLSSLAEKHGLKIVEDAAEAHGAEYKGRRAGGLGDIGCFSFYANKNITTGEGGALVTDDDSLASRARSLRNLAFHAERRFWHTELGYNFRMTNLQAALGLGQLERVDDTISRKREVAALYTEALQGLPIQLPVEREWASNVYWMYGLVIDDGIDMDAAMLAARLKELGVETRPFFLGMHEQPVFHDLGLFVQEEYPVAERLARRGLYLPSGVGLTNEQIADVAAAMRKAFE